MKKVALVIGHQSNNQGAYGSKGIGEWAFNTDLVDDITEVMKSVNAKIFQRSKAISGYSNQMRALHAEIDAWGADISIEFHFNSFSSDSAQGHEVLYCSEGGKKEAIKLNDSLDKYLPTSNRGVKKVTSSDRGGGFCCRGKSYALIIEPFFGSSQHQYIDGGKYREPLINAIVEYLENV